MLYCHSTPHVAGAEGGLHVLDERLAIARPPPVAELSPRAYQHARIDAAFEGVPA